MVSMVLLRLTYAEHVVSVGLTSLSSVRIQFGTRYPLAGETFTIKDVTASLIQGVTISDNQTYSSSRDGENVEPALPTIKNSGI